MQLGGKLNARGAGADDGDLKLVRSQRLVLGIRAQARVEQTLVKAVCILLRIERKRVITRAGRAEIIGAAANCDEKRIVMHRAARQHFAA
jgi:hypothetical protein